MNTLNLSHANNFKERFRGFLPVVVDVETAGVNPNTDALLEVSIVIITIDGDGLLQSGESHFEHILPFDGANLCPKSLAFNKIDPYHPFRFAIDEKKALKNLFQPINKAINANCCQRAVLVGHNAWFDLLFLKAASKRCNLTFPFHAFTCFDTATLSALFYGQTVLAKGCEAANIAFDAEQAHSAIYDANITAKLFCNMINRFKAYDN
jgi:ribonuclease T